MMKPITLIGTGREEGGAGEGVQQTYETNWRILMKICYTILGMKHRDPLISINYNFFFLYSHLSIFLIF
jgi:hypothetical protein